MEEKWVDIQGYEDKYQVSNKGNVKSINYNNTHKEKLLKQKVNRYGYYEVKLSKNNKTKNFLVSTLVAKHFITNKNPDKEVMHVGDIKDNSVENLKYGYRSELLHKMYKRGSRKGKATRYTISYKNKQYTKLAQIAKANNVSPILMYKRLEAGWTLEESIEIPNLGNKIKTNVALYKYNNELISVKEIAKRLNTNAGAIYKRFSRGWSVEEVMEIPIMKKECNYEKKF